jgi:hypothetical protein
MIPFWPKGSLRRTKFLKLYKMDVKSTGKGQPRQVMKMQIAALNVS